MEIRAVNTTLGPDCVILVGLSVVVFGLNDLSPLVHLDFAFEAVTIVRNYAEVLVHDLTIVHRLSSQVHQFKLVDFIRVVGLNVFDHLAALVHTLGEGDDFLFILPEQDEGERNQEKSREETSNTKCIVIV